MSHRLNLIIALVIVTTPAAVQQSGAQPAAAATCPVDRVRARILTVDPGGTTVKVTRAGRAIDLGVRACLMSGDEVDAGNATVEIETPTRKEVISSALNRRTYRVAPDPAAREDPGVVQIVYEMFQLAVENPRVRTPGMGRGETVACEPASPTRKLAALKRLPPGPQQVGTDLSSLLVAWNSAIGRQEVTVQLLRSDGTVLVSRAVCGGGQALLPIDAQDRRPSAELIVRASSQPGDQLEWRIAFVDGARLPAPEKVPSKVWMLGAWRLKQEPKFGIDALTRLQSGTSEYLAAWWIMAAVLGDQG